jgi:hypothetical protein
MPLEPFLADQTAETISFTLISYFELRCVVVKDCSTHRVSVHYGCLYLTSVSAFLPFMVSGLKREKNREIC